MMAWQAKCRTILEKDDLIYEYILQQISPSSMAEIRNDDDFDAVKEEQDWIGLAVIAKEIHLTKVSASNPDRALERQISLTNERSEFRMRDSMSLIACKEKFYGLSKAAKLAGCTDLSEPEQGMQFVKGLDERYVDCLADCYNSDKGFPKTLREAYEKARV